MKIVPISKTNQLTFNGLWEKTFEHPSGYEGHISSVQMKKTYHPFANESEDSIKATIASKKYQFLVPTENDYEFNKVISEPEVGKKLSFTEKEYDAYKKFYDKNVPESIKKIEKELVNNNLGHHLNNKKIAAIKRLLHRIKII